MGRMWTETWEKSTYAYTPNQTEDSLKSQGKNAKNERGCMERPMRVKEIKEIYGKRSN